MLLCFFPCFYSVCTYPSEGSGRQGGNEVVARRVWYCGYRNGVVIAGGGG